ncbi:MAG: starch-binding protein [Muribaculaceae bacterium]|nr:starch-binding protein [Muribaculaceae bacterium]
MRTKSLSILAIAAMLSCAGASAANSYGIPENIQDGNILHCFDWTFADIKAELPAIAEAGFGAVQVSPVQGNCATNAEWFYAYMPYDFAFKQNGNGSRTQLQSLCQEAAKYGIKIVVDVVANHVNQASGYHHSWWDSNGRVRWEGGVNYGNRYSITHGQLGEYGDVNSEDAEVQARAVAFLEDLKSLGVAGIRWDAAKHIGLPSENCNFWPKMASVAGLWHYGEILDTPGGDKYTLLKEYTSYIGVTDSEYSKWCREQVCGGNVPSGGASWAANGVNPSAIVFMAESHDDYSNDGQYGTNSANIPQDKIDRAYAITACRKGETSLYFSRPAATTRNAIKMGQKGSTHFTTKEVAEVNKFRNAMAGTDDYYSASNGIACITRKGGGACIVVGAGGSRNVSVANGGGYVPAGTYTDHISGNSFTVTASTISGQVGSTGIAVIYGEVSHEPIVTFSPNGGEFQNSVSVTATASYATSAWYKIGNGSQVSFSGSKTFTLGADMEAGQSVTVSWSATGEEGTRSGSVVFKKVDKPANAYVYLDNSAGWSAPCVWAWIENGANCTAKGLWPGDPMTKQADGRWLWTAPDGKTPTHIILSDNGNSQTADLQFFNGHVYKCDGSHSEDGNGGGSGDDDNVQMPASLYVLGNLAGAQWNTAAGVAMTKAGNTFEADKLEFVAAGTESVCYFNLTDALGADWDVLNATANRYGATSEGASLSVGGSSPMKKYANNVDASGCLSWSVIPGSYKLVADFASMTVKLLPVGTSGIDAIDSDSDSPAEYYNLQGVRVAEPAPGMYIMVRNGKASKVIIR